MDTLGQNKIEGEIRRYLGSPFREEYVQITLTYIAVSIFIIFAIRPSFLKSVETYKLAQIYKDANQKLLTKSENIDKADSVIKENADRLGLLDMAMPNSSSEGDLIRIINLVAINNSVSLLGVKFSDTPQAEENLLSKFSVETSVKGSKENLFKFTSDLSNLLRIVNVTDVDYTFDQKTTGSDTILIKGETYFMKIENEQKD